MDARQRHLWNSRPMTVTVLDRCDECKTLKPDVKRRESYFPNITATCCAICFSEMVGEREGAVVC